MLLVHHNRLGGPHVIEIPVHQRHLLFQAADANAVTSRFGRKGVGVLGLDAVSRVVLLVVEADLGGEDAEAVGLVGLPDVQPLPLDHAVHGPAAQLALDDVIVVRLHVLYILAVLVLQGDLQLDQLVDAGRNPVHVAHRLRHKLLLLAHIPHAHAQRRDWRVHTERRRVALDRRLGRASAAARGAEPAPAAQLPEPLPERAAATLVVGGCCGGGLEFVARQRPQRQAVRTLPVKLEHEARPLDHGEFVRREDVARLAARRLGILVVGVPDTQAGLADPVGLQFGEIGDRKLKHLARLHRLGLPNLLLGERDGITPLAAGIPLLALNDDGVVLRRRTAASPRERSSHPDANFWEGIALPHLWRRLAPRRPLQDQGAMGGTVPDLLDDPHCDEAQGDQTEQGVGADDDSD